MKKSKREKEIVQQKEREKKREIQKELYRTRTIQ